MLGEAAAWFRLGTGALFLQLVLAGILWWFGMGRKGLSPILPSWLFLTALCFFWAGFFRMENSMKPLPQELLTKAGDGRYGEALGEIKSVTLKDGTYRFVTENNQLFCGEEEYCLPRLITYLQEIYIENPEEIKIGMKVRLKGELGLFSPPRNPGEFDFSLYYQSLKIKCNMFADTLVIENRSYSPYFNACDSFRKRCADLLGRICGEEDLGLMKAILLGDKSDLGDEIRQLYQKNGIAHLLAVSGLHISLIGMGAYRLLRRGGISYGRAGAACALLAVTYGVMTGSGSSAIRAVIMLLCCFLAEYAGRTYDMISAAGLAALFLLWDSPLLLFQSGFQLSFSAVLAIGGAGKILAKWLGEGRLKENLAVSLSIQIITFPVILYHFYQFPMYSILLNFLVLPLIGIGAGSGMLGIFAAFFSVKAGIWAVGPAHYILLFYRFLCTQFEKLPWYTVILGRPNGKQLVLYYALVFLFLWYAFRSGSGEKEGEKKKIGGRGRWGLVFAVCLSGFFIMLPREEEGLAVTFLDVGQGDGIWMETDGCGILVDGGSSQVKHVGKDRLEPFLKSKGISRIDYAFVSHGDSDHISGLEYLLSSCPDITISNLVLPFAGKGEEVYERLAGLLSQRGGTVWYIKAGDCFQRGGLKMECLHPEQDFLASNRNNQSEVLFVTYGGETGFRMLLTGDAEREAEERILESRNLKPVHLLKVGHHGSDTSTGQDFLDAFSPKWCVISYGKGNSYGHPKKEIVERIKEMGAEIWTTAGKGAVTVKTDGRKVTIEGYLDCD